MRSGSVYAFLVIVIALALISPMVTVVQAQALGDPGPWGGGWDGWDDPKKDKKKKGHFY